MCGFYFLHVAVEFVKFFKIAKVVTDADGWVDAFGLAEAKRATKICLLYGRNHDFCLLHVVRIQIDERISIIVA